MAQPIEKQPAADGAREPGEEGHGGRGAGDWVEGSFDCRPVGRLSLREKRLHEWWVVPFRSACNDIGARDVFALAV